MTTIKTLSSLRDLYTTDLTAIENGTWFQLKRGNSLVKVRSFGSQVVSECNNNLTERYKAELKVVEIPSDSPANGLILRELVAKAILTDWKNVADEKGKELPFSTEAAYKILSEEGIEELVMEIFDFSTNSESFKISSTKNASKLLKKK